METNQIKIEDFDEIMTHTSEQSKTASASGSAEKRLVAAPRECTLAVLRVLDKCITQTDPHWERTKQLI